MTTLTTPPLAPLLVRLFADADATDTLLTEQLAALPPDERASLLSGSNDRALYASLKDFHLAVSRETATLLYMLARATAPRSIVEFGMSFAISTLHLAAALKDNGGGHLITTELEPSKVARGRENLAAAGLAGLVDIREGDALETLSRDLPSAIDLVLLDGSKSLYPGVLALLEPRMRAGALIVADNADRSREYLERVRSNDGYLSIPFADDVELSMRLKRAGPAS